MQFFTRPNQRSLTVTAILGSTLMLLGACSGNGTQGGENGHVNAKKNIALYKGHDRQKILKKCANGPISLYTNPTAGITKDLVTAFHKQYSNINVKVTRGDAAQTARRVAEEYSAGRYNVDVVETSFGALTELKQTGALQPYWSPEMSAYPKQTIDRDNYFATSRSSHIGLGYNTNLLSAKQVPKTYEDLLDPKWEGRMAISSGTTPVRWIGMLDVTQGKTFLRRLKKQDITVQNMSSRALADQIVSGEVTLSPTIYDSHVTISSRVGAPIEWQPLEPVVTLPTGPALAAKAPHPCASMLYIDFLLSPKGQEIYHKHGYQSARKGMSKRADFKTIVMDTRDDWDKKYDEWETWMQKNLI